MNAPIARWPALVLPAVATLAAVQVVALLLWYWPGALPDTNTSGVWIALADDVAHGTWYRPLQGELGTGGTRYLPLFFTLHGAMIAAGFSPLGSGIALTLASAAAVGVALAALLRALDVPRAVAVPMSVLLFGTVTLQMLLLTVRGDFLATACTLGGLAIALRARERGQPRALVLAALLFAAAFLTKVTSVFGLVAIVGAWLWQRDVRAAIQLVSWTAGAMVAGIGLASWASDGRFFASFQAVASGDTDVGFVFRAPIRLLVECAGDPLWSILAVGAIVAAIGIRATPAGRFLLGLGMATLAVTIVIFGSPGTGKNHLVDLQVVALAFLAVAFGQGERWRRAVALCVAIMGVGMVATWVPGVPSVRRFFEYHHRPEIAAVTEFLARAGEGARPMLSENPLVPILAGERPFVADLFNLELLARHDAAFREAFLGRLRAGEFGSVVLSNYPSVFPRDVASPDDPLIAECWPHLEQRGRVADGFYAALRARYRIVLVRRPYIYLLRDDRPFARGP